MDLLTEICTRRDVGKVTVDIASANPTIPDMDRLDAYVADFGFSGLNKSWIEITQATALTLLVKILNQDMAYDGEVMDYAEAERLALAFLSQFDEPFRCFTNGNFYDPPRQTGPHAWSGPTWTPITAVTFDTGVVVLADHQIGILWVEDED